MAMNSGHRFTGFLQMCKPLRLCVWSCSHHTHIPSCPLQGREHSEEPWPESRPERADAETRQAHWAVPFPPRLLGKTQMAWNVRAKQRGNPSRRTWLTAGTWSNPALSHLSACFALSHACSRRGKREGLMRTASHGCWSGRSLRAAELTGCSHW